MGAELNRERERERVNKHYQKYCLQKKKNENNNYIIVIIKRNTRLFRFIQNEAVLILGFKKKTFYSIFTDKLRDNKKKEEEKQPLRRINTHN